MTPQELKAAHLAKRAADLAEKWNGRVRPQSPPCETCGKAKLGPTPKGKK